MSLILLVLLQFTHCFSLHFFWVQHWQVSKCWFSSDNTCITFFENPLKGPSLLQFCSVRKLVPVLSVPTAFSPLEVCPSAFLEAYCDPWPLVVLLGEYLEDVPTHFLWCLNFRNSSSLPYQS